MYDLGKGEQLYKIWIAADFYFVAAAGEREALDLSFKSRFDS